MIRWGGTVDSSQRWHRGSEGGAGGAGGARVRRGDEGGLAVAWVRQVDPWPGLTAVLTNATAR
jgi:hypothetical protein